MKKLPTGIQRFSKLIEEDYLYVDKTKDIFNLIDRGKNYFLSRPQRFGKSLLLSTIEELYQGNQELFKGLWIENQWDWSKKNPVIHISFNNLDYKKRGLTAALENKLNNLAKQFNLVLNEQSISQRFRELIKKLSSKNGNIVILIDEYNKPILDYLGKDFEQVLKNQDILDDFYSVLKESGEYLEFILITGMCKTYFRSIDFLNDLTIHPKFSTILGYTQDEIEHYFEDRTNFSVANFEELKSNFGGYSWDGENFVYHPFATLFFFKNSKYYNFFQNPTTPTFLTNLLKEENVKEIPNTFASDTTICRLELKNWNISALLFHTGYFTMKNKETEFPIFELNYPNQKSKNSINHLLKNINPTTQIYV